MKYLLIILCSLMITSTTQAVDLNTDLSGAWRVVSYFSDGIGGRIYNQDIIVTQSPFKKDGKTFYDIKGSIGELNYIGFTVEGSQFEWVFLAKRSGSVLGNYLNTEISTIVLNNPNSITFKTQNHIRSLQKLGGLTK